MQLKAIALCDNKKIPERILKNMVLKLASKKPKCWVVILPEGHIFYDALSIDYLTSIKIDEKDVSCDMGMLDELNRLFLTYEIPSIFLNPEKLESFQIKAEITEPALDFLSYATKIMPDLKICLISAADLPKEQLLEAGRIIREACERLELPTEMICFTDLQASIEEENILDLLRSSDYPAILEKPVPTSDPSPYDALVIALGATEQLKTIYLSYGNLKADGVILEFALENADIKKDQTSEFMTDSLINWFKQRRQEMLQVMKENESELIKMIRETARLYVTERKVLDFDEYVELTNMNPSLAERLKLQQTGAFVTLIKDEKPRGGMGTVTPVQPCLAEEIINNTITACCFDPGFEQVREDELDDLLFELTILEPAQEIEDISELDPEKFGIIYEQGLKRGVVLPGIYGIDTAEEQIELAKARAGIIEGIDDLDPVIILKFSVEQF